MSSDMPSGHLGNLDAKQAQALTAMQAMFAEDRKAVADIPDHPFPLDDYGLLRFLRARKFDIPAAAQMLRKTLEWRKANGVDQILSNPPAKLAKLQELYAKAIPAGYSQTFSKGGNPIFALFAGGVATQALTKFVTIEDCLLCHIWDMERHQQLCRQQSESLGRKIECVVNILDTLDMGMSARVLIPYLQALSALDADNYPETLAFTIISNAPSIFPVIYSWAQAFLDPVVASKVIIDSQEPSIIMLDRVWEDRTDLPVQFGGEAKVTPDVASDEALLAECIAEEKKMGLTALNIAAGVKGNVTIPIPAAHTTVEWYFRTAYYNIAYSVTFQPTEGKAVTVVNQTAESQQLPEKGQVSIGEGKAGVLIVEWDNSSSWMNAKNVSHLVTARPYSEYDDRILFAKHI